MKILAMHDGHDGSVVYLNDAKLEFLIEGEKGSGSRHDRYNSRVLLEGLSRIQAFPDIIASGGWNFDIDKRSQTIPNRIHTDPYQASYGDLANSTIKNCTRQAFGQDYQCFSSSHVRSHIFMSYGMSPFEQGRPCYILIWEAGHSRFYEVLENMEICELGTPLLQPGSRYAWLYHLADKKPQGNFMLDAAGKLMALVAYGELDEETKKESEFLKHFLMKNQNWLPQNPFQQYKDSGYVHIGVESQAFKNLARKFSDRLFDLFYQHAKKYLTKGYPLLIGGGCGLNCEWNTRWRDCGLFPEVFVPPCPNDSGSALGTAIDAQYFYTGNAKIDWNVYAGEEFLIDTDVSNSHTIIPLDYEIVTSLLADGKVLGWVQGKYEIGPRALGNRSMLAAPFTKETLDRLNHIKMREAYRPVAPICLAEDVSKHFAWQGESPYMLYFQKVISPELKAVTHVDGSARVQTVTAKQNQALHTLLLAFKQKTGFGVLCNTSLNFKGKGFVNRLSDLIVLQERNGLDALVVNGRMYIPLLSAKRFDGAVVSSPTPRHSPLSLI